MTQPQLTQLKYYPESGRIFVEVRFKGFPIQKWLDPAEPGHPAEIAIFRSGNPAAINAIVAQLGNELKQALKHPDVGILDQNDNVIIPTIPSAPVEIDLLNP